MFRKILTFIFLLLSLSGCGVVVQQTLVPTADIEKTVYWMVDDAVSKASTQIMYDVSLKLETMNVRMATETSEISETPEVSSTKPIPSQITSVPESIRERKSGEIQETLPACVDELKFMEDLSIPDKTVVTAGKPFTKTWKIQNSGSCVWNDDYLIVFSEGDRMSALEETAFPAEIIVNPDDTIDVSVYMTAPNEKGSYAGYWLLQSPSGIRFGAGTNRDKPIWVKVEVR